MMNLLLWTLSSALAAPPVPPLSAEMHERFAIATTVRDHVIQGHLEEARVAAGGLVDLAPPEGLPSPWRPWVAQMKAAAAHVASAPDLNEAAMATGRLGVTCADCHAEMRGGPGLEGARDVPPQRWSEGANMPLHKWAVDWMWLGLIGPSDEAWQRGAAELDSKPLAPRFEDSTSPEGLRELEQLVYVLANKAVKTGDVDFSARGELLGELMGTCAQCHVKRNAGKIPPKIQEAP